MRLEKTFLLPFLLQQVVVVVVVAVVAVVLVLVALVLVLFLVGMLGLEEQELEVLELALEEEQKKGHSVRTWTRASAAPGAGRPPPGQQ